MNRAPRVPQLLGSIRQQPRDFWPHLAVRLTENAGQITVFLRDIEHSMYPLLISLAHDGQQIYDLVMPPDAWLVGEALDQLLAAEQPLELLLQVARPPQAAPAKPASRRGRPSKIKVAA